MKDLVLERVGLCAVSCALALFPLGCGTSRNATPVSVMSSEPRDDGMASQVEICAVQYAMSTGNEGGETVEVLLKNQGQAPVRFVRVELDGIELPPIRADVQAAMRNFRFEGMGGSRKRPVHVKPVAGARWWQFRPSANMAGGEYGLFQLNFVGRSRPCVLSFFTSDGQELQAQVPRHDLVRRHLSYLAFSEDGRRVLVRYSKGRPPVAFRVNGASVDFRVLEPLTEGWAGGLVGEMLHPIREGEHLLIEVEFPEAKKRWAFVRAMLGVCTVAPDGWRDDEPLPVDTRKEYGFDETLRVHRLACDPICDDSRAHEHGASARDVVGLRTQWAAAHGDGLCGVDFCTAMYPSAWNIYSQMADVAFVKPYRLHWGRNPARFVDEEDAFIADSVQSVSPRPVIWIPERFGERRCLQGPEFEVLAWCAFLRGARGVRVHHWKNRGLPFAGNVGLAEAIRRFNRELSGIRPRLGQLIPAGSYEVRRDRIAVLAGWIADEGLLFLFRNLRYDTGILASGGGREHPFVVTKSADMSVPLIVAKSFLPDGAVDALTGEALGLDRSAGRWLLSLPELSSFRLVRVAGKHVIKKGGAL